MRSAPITANQAVDNAVASVASGDDSFERRCLAWVRGECWHLDPLYGTAQEAWRNASNRVPYAGNPFAIPHGAPLFSLRPHAGPSDAGHVFIACGVYKDSDGTRHRIFRGTDIRYPGRASSFTMPMLVNRWRHTILGHTLDLNGYDLNLPNRAKDK